METKPVGITLVAVRFWLSLGNVETDLNRTARKMKRVSLYLTAVVLICFYLFDWKMILMTPFGLCMNLIVSV